MTTRFRNWGRTAECQPIARVEPSTEQEISALVRDAAATGKRVKPVGAGHSWSEIACTDGIQLSLDRMKRVIAIDKDRLEITVEAGLRLKELNVLLAQEGLALGVLGSIAEQSIAGAIATGTHGSAPGRGSLSSLVTALRLVTGTGDVLELSREKDPDTFDAARVAIGALGVITQVTLKCEKAFVLEEIVEPMPIAEALARIPQLLEEEPYVKLWWLPHTGKVQIFRYRPTTAAPTLSEFARWMDEHVVNAFGFALVLALGRWFPGLIPALTRLVGALYFKAVRRIGRSDRLLNIAMPPLHEETEFALPVEQAADAVAWLAALVEREKLGVNFVAELRFSAAEDAWMSPSYGRASCHLGAYMAKSRDLRRYFEAFEAQMLERGGRPHWGKQFRAGHAELAPVLPNLPRFKALSEKLDPKGVFRNDWLDRLFGA